MLFRSLLTHRSIARRRSECLSRPGLHVLEGNEPPDTGKVAITLRTRTQPDSRHASASRMSLANAWRHWRFLSLPRWPWPPGGHQNDQRITGRDAARQCRYPTWLECHRPTRAETRRDRAPARSLRVPSRRRAPVWSTSIWGGCAERCARLVLRQLANALDHLRQACDHCIQGFFVQSIR